MGAMTTLADDAAAKRILVQQQPSAGTGRNTNMNPPTTSSASTAAASTSTSAFHNDNPQSPCLAARARQEAAKMASLAHEADTSASRPAKRRRTSSTTAAATTTTTTTTTMTAAKPDSKRSTSRSSTPQTHQRARTHALRHIQHLPAAVEPAPQDAAFVQSQLLRSITAALHMAGYDSARPSALESFRALVEETMLVFLHAVRANMHNARRSTPTAVDFTYALSAFGLSSADLAPHLALPVPSDLAAPHVPAPRPAEPAPTDLAPMLGAALHRGPAQNRYIPAHFPPLPSTHTYRSTPVFSQREHDPMKIRERAMEEGVLAEKALRRLTAAQAAAATVDRAVPGRRGRGAAAVKARKRDEVWGDVMGEMLEDDADERDSLGAAPSSSMDSGVRDMGGFDLSFGSDGAADEKTKAPDKERTVQPKSTSEKLDAVMRSGRLSVNHDRGHWRRGAGAAVR